MVWIGGHIAQGAEIMGELSPSKLNLLKTLVLTSPDRVLMGLAQAFSAEGPYDASLVAVRTLVEGEARTRRVRNSVFAPIAPMCRGADTVRLTFPTRTLGLLWAGLCAETPELVDSVTALLTEWRADQPSLEPLDRLCVYAAAAIRDRADGPFAEAAKLCEKQAEGLSETLARCLDMAAVTRRALERLPDWLGRMDQEKTAELRLYYGDVCKIDKDGGPRYFEMLAGHLAEPWQILRVISGVMDKPTEAYLAASELSTFASGVVEQINEATQKLSKFNATSGVQAGHAAAKAIDAITHQIAELEHTVTLSPTGPWGNQVARMKKQLAGIVEGQLKVADDVVGLALPLQIIRLGPKTTKGVPKLTADPDPVQVDKALTLLTFVNETRASAQTGGYASLRTKIIETVEARLDAYVEDILDHIRNEAGDNDARPRAYLEVAAELYGLIRDEKAAQIVRRRAAAA